MVQEACAAEVCGGAPDTMIAVADQEDEPVVHPRHHDELANCITHGIGFTLSAVGAVALILVAEQAANDLWLIGCGIYAATLVAVYAASTLSHAFHRPSLRRFFRTLDQAFIYLLIVGTYTPLALRYLLGGWLTTLLVAMWVVALIGFFSKMLWRHRIDAVSLTAYIVLGWMPILAGRAAWSLLPLPASLLTLGGGLCYTLGTVFLLSDHRRFFHALWHLFVMAGSACHFVAILCYVAMP